MAQTVLAGAVLIGLALLVGCQADGGATNPSNASSEATGKKWEIMKSDEEWKKQLTPEQYRVTRQKGTERAGTGEYDKTTTEGVYHCICCDQALYSSETKYDSGSGWPSYWAPIDEEAVATEHDGTFGMVRTEILCSRCGAHLGHVFDDGPRPTGMRHCVNSASLRLEPKSKDKE